MQTETFDWLWQQMKTDIEAIENEMLTYNTTDTTANPFSFKLTYGSSTKQTIYEAYLKIKTDLKKRCYASEINEEKEFNLVDQHKIAACFCKAFIDKKVFTFELKENTPPDMILSNYTLAYTISLRIIFLYLMDYYSDYQTNLDLQLKTNFLKSRIQILSPVDCIPLFLIFLMFLIISLHCRFLKQINVKKMHIISVLMVEMVQF